MRKALPYILVAVVIVLLGVILAGGRNTQPRRMDERVTLRQRDKIPYGTSAAKALLPSLFPKAGIAFDVKGPGLWDGITPSSYNQAVVIVARYFNADEYELARLIEFVEKGNYVFIIARSFSDDAERIFNFSSSRESFDDFSSNADSLSLNLDTSVFAASKNYIYPGKKFGSSFEAIDRPRTVILGRNGENKPNFIAMKRGSGALFIHSTPAAFSNYFILHKDNIHYFETAFSVIPREIDEIVWNEYYLLKPVGAGSGNRGGSRDDEEKEPGWLSVLFRYPAFKWGMLTVLFTLIAYVVLGMRRRQRMIPLYTRPRNDSLDFVKTMGRLYHDRRDHQNLAKKMAVYFLEHVRSSYKLPTHEMNEQFLQALQFKSGYGGEELREIVAFIKDIRDGEDVTEEQLARFHKQLETFYQNT